MTQFSFEWILSLNCLCQKWGQVQMQAQPFSLLAKNAHEAEMRKRPIATEIRPVLKSAPNPTIPAKQEDRIFVNESPLFLTNCFDGHRTDLQARTLVEPYLNKWMTLSRVVVTDVHADDSIAWSEYIVFGDMQDDAKVVMYFDKEWADRIVILRRGSILDAIGQIDKVHLGAVRFKHCEIVPTA